MFVYADGKVSPRTVEIGEAFGNRFEILSGLKPGDKVVTRGNERLRPGQEVILRGGERNGDGARDRAPASGGSKAPSRSSDSSGRNVLPGIGRAEAAERRPAGTE